MKKNKKKKKANKKDSKKKKLKKEKKLQKKKQKKKKKKNKNSETSTQSLNHNYCASGGAAKCYHRLTCWVVVGALERDGCLFFETEEDANAAGYRPCSRCK